MSETNDDHFRESQEAAAKEDRRLARKRFEVFAPLSSEKPSNDRAVRDVNYEKRGGAPTGSGHGAGAGKDSTMQQPGPVER